MINSNTGHLLSAMTRNERERLAYITNDPNYAATFNEMRRDEQGAPNERDLKAFRLRNAARTPLQRVP